MTKKINLKHNTVIRELFIIIGFGLLSLVLSKVKFVVPGAEGSLSDLRAVPLIISVFYIRRWYSILFLSVFTVIIIFEGASIWGTYVLHVICLIYLFFTYKFLHKRFSNSNFIFPLWIGAMLIYFYLVNYPVLVLFSWILGFVEPVHFIAKYIDLTFEIRFEMMLTTLISLLYLMYVIVNYRLQCRNQELYKSMKKAEESDRLKTAFLQNLSHEIRTPMNGIQGFSRLLIMHYESPEQTKQYCEHVLKCGDQLLNIVNDIIDISQIETEQVEMTYTTTAFNGVIDNVITNLEASGNYNLSRLSFNFNNCDQLSVKSDLYKIERILYHLIENALKFSGNQEVVLECEIKTDYLNFIIKDKGIGIDDKHKELIFVKFQQVESDLSRSYGGNGLGLSIVKGFVNKLNGVIGIESVENKGTTVTVQVPLHKNI